ncbi:MAG: M24 family metallopeptidase [Pseudomonadales bacterium]
MPRRKAESKITKSIQRSKAEVSAAGSELHHLNLGPGEALEKEWQAAGLTLPNLPQMREYRLQRVVDQLNKMGYDGALLFDPMNIRYVTDSTNMQLWVMHNNSRYVWVGADGSVVLWDYVECEFLSAHNPLIKDVRPAVNTIFFLAGTRYAEKTDAWAADVYSVIERHAGRKPRIAIDQCCYLGYKALEGFGVRIESGQEMMEYARAIKSPDEVNAMKCAVHACEASMDDMWRAFQPGMTERELWSILHAGNIKRAGEWIETQLLCSGPRTNPWMQEASSRVIQEGDVVAYDTDLIGAYGMLVDISRSWVAGSVSPSPSQQATYDMARQQVELNAELLTAGRSFKELSDLAWFPAVEDYRHYGMLYHGAGQCDEYPEIPFPHNWESAGFDGELESGMVLTSEAYVGPRAGGEGIKLEQQYLVTENGPELLSHYPMDFVR